MMELAYNMETLPYCCGCYEVGEMYWTNEDSYNAGDYYAHVDKAIPKILEKADGCSVIFNFVCERTEDRLWDEVELDHMNRVPLNDEYKCQEFMDIVAGYPGILKLHTWINPKTGNEITSYMIKGTGPV